MPAADVIRELLVALGVKVDPKSKKEQAEFDRAIERTKERMQDFGDFALDAGKKLAAGLVAAAGAAGLLAVTTGQDAESIERQARALNLTRKEYQEFQYVFGKFGSDSKEISEAFLQITEKTTDLVAGNKSVADEFALIGLKAKDLKGKRPNEIFETVADAMAKTTDRQKALGAASKLFGEDTAKKLLPALVQGGAAIRRMREEAHALGVVLTDAQLAKGRATAEAWFDFKMTVSGLAKEVGVELGPAVVYVLRSTQEWIRTNRRLISQRIEYWAKNLERALIAANEAAEAVGGWDVVFANVATGTGLIMLLANLDKVEKVLSAIRLAQKAVEVGFKALALELGIPFAAAAGIVLLVVGGLVLLGLQIDDMLTTLRGGRSVLGGLFDWLETVVPGFAAWRDLIGAVWDLFAMGVTNVGRLKDAITTGLKPVLNGLILQFGELLAPLRAAWEYLDKILSSPLGQAAQFIRGLTAQSDAAGLATAGMVQTSLAGTVEGQIARGGGGRGSTDNSVRTASSVNHFHGATAGDVHTVLEGDRRRAGLAVKGGER